MSKDADEKKDKIYRNPYFWTCIGITIVFILLSVFLFRHSYVRLYQSIMDLINSFRYYAHILFHTKKDVSVTVIDIPEDFYSFSFNFNIDWTITGVRWASWWSILWRRDTWNAFSNSFFWFLFYFMEILMLLILVGVLIYFLFQRMFKPSGKEVGSGTKPYLWWMKIREKVILPVKYYFINLWGYIKSSKYFYIPWIILWILNFNLGVIVIEFLAYYFYFIVSFDFRHLWNQLVKLVGDLSPMLTFIPIWVWIFLILIFLRRRGINRGYERLENLEARNKQFVASLGVSTLLCGEMGVGKTSTMTDMALSLSQYFRYEAKKRLLEKDLMFPNFPWSTLECDIRSRMYLPEGNPDRIYSLASVRKYCDFLTTGVDDKNYFYQYLLSGERDEYYDGKKNNILSETVTTYALLYFIYVTESSIIVSNYSIREDNVLVDYGFFPMWSESFFRKHSSSYMDYSLYSHILDFDSVRLGNTVSNSSYKDSLEFGVVVITEGGKERLNQLGLQGVKKDSFEANQKNDLFDMWLKLYRHSATVDNFCFGKILIDEQRPMSLGADLREVCQDVIFIKNEEKNQSVLRMKFFGSFFLEKIDKWFESHYYRFKQVRGDNTLFIYFMKWWSGIYIRRQTKWNNLFGYSKLTLQVESGDLDPSHSTFYDYYLCYHKIYSDRYASDCFNDFFYSKASRSIVGINDLPSYKTVTASMDDLRNQNSYFIRSLDAIFADYLKEINSEDENEEEKVNEVSDLKEGDPADALESDESSGNE